MTTNNLKTGSKYTCKYCGRQFTREKTLAVHLCEPKRRMQQQHEKWVQVGYATYQRFYSLTQGNGDDIDEITETAAKELKIERKLTDIEKC